MRAFCWRNNGKILWSWSKVERANKPGQTLKRKCQAGTLQPAAQSSERQVGASNPRSLPAILADLAPKVLRTLVSRLVISGARKELRLNDPGYDMASLFRIMFGCIPLNDSREE